MGVVFRHKLFSNRITCCSGCKIACCVLQKSGHDIKIPLLGVIIRHSGAASIHPYLSRRLPFVQRARRLYDAQQ